jgi:translation initiation factor IF-3
LARNYRINKAISAPTVRTISESGEALGVLARDEALRRAEELEVDLVEIAPNADPPVAKLVDYKKYLYQEERKEREARKGAHRVEMKELWLGPLMGEHDLMTRVERGKEFLSTGDHVKFVVRYTGRQMAHREIGYKVLDKLKGLLVDFADIEKEPVFIGRQLSIQFKPKRS